ncbi:MAG: aspartate dehydrogenase [Euryarchaeota archaeon]|nr:aspartate dehydrogenase [Euryarchaeota archaeon]MBU4139277.1 aspartate dehydrogenase [Euryarchaeota archaeon]
MLKVGVIGCGAIGIEICRAIDRGIVKAQLSAVHDRSIENCEGLLASLVNKPAILPPDEMISNADIIVECASAQAVREFGVNILEMGKDLMVLSAGAFRDSGLLERLTDTARAHHCRIYIPSGAIAGIDGLKSAAVAGINKVTLTTTKNPKGLKGAPFIEKNNINIDSYREKTLLFEGNADEAIAAFPANVNVAVSLSLAGIGIEKTHVRIFVDPGAKRNIHEVSVEGDFGKFTCRVENVPSPGNPRTSYLAALSAIATLKKITEPLQIGT